jgi:hypothetical protein
MKHDNAALAALLTRFCLERIAGTEDFARAEPSVQDDLNAMLCDAFACALQAFDDALLADREPGWRVRDRRRRSVLTEFGDVTYARRAYTDECGDRRILLDELLALRPRKRLSPGASKALAHFGGEVPYARAAKACFRHCAANVYVNSKIPTSLASCSTSCWCGNPRFRR